MLGWSAKSCSANVVETRAPRRSDTLRTALLRAVSHDLRPPAFARHAVPTPAQLRAGLQASCTRCCCVVG